MKTKTVSEKKFLKVDKIRNFRKQNDSLNIVDIKAQSRLYCACLKGFTFKTR